MNSPTAVILVSLTFLWFLSGRSGAAPAAAAEPPAIAREKESPETMRVGNTVVVVAESADVTWNGKVIARIPRGGTFRVLQVRQDMVSGWIKILNRQDIDWTKRGHEIGWVRRDQVAVATPDQVDPAAPAVAIAVVGESPDASPSRPAAPPVPEKSGPVEKALPGGRSPGGDARDRLAPAESDLAVPPEYGEMPADRKDAVAEVPGGDNGDAGHFSCRTFSGQNRQLCAAVSDGHIEEVRRLLAAKANINARSERSHTEGMTLLQVAVWHQWGLDKIQLLIQAGADVNAVDGHDRTALTLAMARQPTLDPALVRLLMAAGADVNSREKRGMTALMHASMRDDIQVVKMLIDAGADVRARDEAGWSALMHATRRSCGHAEVVQLLVRSGADVNARHLHGGTALASAAFNGHLRAVEILIQAGAQVNTADENGWTPLICACTGGHGQIVAALVAAGADVRARDRLGRTPLSIASDKGMAETADLLARAGAR